MMDRLFRIDFYPQDWLIDTAKLTNEQRGLFINICSLIYANRGPIIHDVKWIGTVSNCSSRAARSLIDELIVLDFLQTSDGKLSQKRAAREIIAKKMHLNSSSRGGKNKAENSAKMSRTSHEHVTNTSRTSHETQPTLFKNNDLISSEGKISLPSSSPTPIVSKKEIIKEKGSRFTLTDLPEDWKKYCLEKRPDLNPNELFDEFRDYWIAVPGARGRKLDWSATWRNRVRDKRKDFNKTSTNQRPREVRDGAKTL